MHDTHTGPRPDRRVLPRRPRQAPLLHQAKPLLAGERLGERILKQPVGTPILHRAPGRSQPCRYLGMAAHWPNANDPIAATINAADKVVFSKTLTAVDWQNSSLAQADPAEELDRLRRQPGKIIGVAGGAAFAQYVSSHGLVDEYRLTIHPVVLGDGIRLFADPLKLRLIAAETFDTGAVVHTYRPG
jgi:dihydrofolate reductase